MEVKTKQTRRPNSWSRRWRKRRRTRRRRRRGKITLTLLTELKWEPELVWTVWKAATPDYPPEINSRDSLLALAAWKPTGRQYNQCSTPSRSNTFVSSSRQHSNWTCCPLHCLFNW